MASYIAYYRVSTAKQGLGLDAQAAAAERFAASRGGHIVASFEEKESGKNDNRPQLAAAIHACKAQKAILLIAKLDRLSRNVAFLFQLKERLAAAGVEVIAADMPEVLQNTLMLSVMAGMAQHERELISARTKAALATLKASGKKLGASKGADMSKAVAASVAVRSGKAAAAAEKHCHSASALYRGGTSLSEIARIFNTEGKTTPRGSEWTATAIRRLLIRCGTITA